MSLFVCVWVEVGGVVLDLLNLEVTDSHSRANTRICWHAESAHM